MCDKMAISTYILKIVEQDPFLRLQMRAKEMFNRHQNYIKVGPASSLPPFAPMILHWRLMKYS